MGGVTYFLRNFSHIFSFLSPFLQKFPIKILPMQLENMISLFSRTGRHHQRYGSGGSRLVVGCIPYRYRKTAQSNSLDGTLVEELEVLVISSQKGEAMLFPKGGWEIDESMEEAASRETLEEAGVIGKIEHKLGKWRYKSKRQPIIHEGYMFPLLVKQQLDHWPEKNIRKREWVTVARARELCPYWWMREALDELVRRQIRRRRKAEENESTRE